MSTARLITLPHDAHVADATALRYEIANAQNDIEHVLDLGPDWAPLHAVLTAEAPIPKSEAQRRGISWDDDSLENVLMGGEPTALKSRWLSHEEVARLAARLGDIDDAGFRDLYDPDLLEELHMDPSGVDRLLERFQALRSLFATAARQRRSLMIEID